MTHRLRQASRGIMLRSTDGGRIRRKRLVAGATSAPATMTASMRFPTVRCLEPEGRLRVDSDLTFSKPATSPSGGLRAFPGGLVRPLTRLFQALGSCRPKRSCKLQPVLDRSRRKRKLVGANEASRVDPVPAPGARRLTACSSEASLPSTRPAAFQVLIAGSSSSEAIMRMESRTVAAAQREPCQPDAA